MQVFLSNLKTLIIFSIFSQSQSTTPKKTLLNLPFPERYALSTTYLTHLSRVEIEIYKAFVEFIKSESNTVVEENPLELYINDYDKTSTKIIDALSPLRKINQWACASEVARNSLGALRMLRRFAKLLNPAREYLESLRESDSILQLINKFQTSAFPRENDYNEAIDALLQIQTFYDTQPLDLARGLILKTQTAASLEAAQCLEIGKVAVQQKKFSLAIKWFQAGENLNRKSNDGSLYTAEIAEQMQLLIELHDKEFDNIYSNKRFLFTQKLSENISASTIREENLKKFFGVRDTGVKSLKSDPGFYNFIALCNGHESITEEEKRHLFCWLERKQHPYFLLNPIKMELKSKEPYLVLMHKVIKSKWLVNLWKASAPVIIRQQVSIPESYENILKKRPEATYAWLLDEEIPNTPISKRVELITGLNVLGNGSELIQITAYAMGAHAENHVDVLRYLEPDLVPKGHRLSSFLFYITDVIEGGATVFPNLGVSIKAESGSAIYWFAVQKNGQIDYRAAHGGCPVALGHKWIGIKFIHQYSNFLKWPCDVNSKPRSIMESKYGVWFTPK